MVWRRNSNGCGCQTPMGSHFGVGEFTTHLRTCFSGWIGSRSLGANRFGFGILTHGGLPERHAIHGGGDRGHAGGLAKPLLTA